MGVELDAEALLVTPLVLLVGVIEVDIARELLPEAEGGAPLCLMLGFVEP